MDFSNISKAISNSSLLITSGGCHVIQFPDDTLKDKPSSKDEYNILSDKSVSFIY